MAKQSGFEELYQFIYKMTSNSVHFNPQNLLRYCWDKGQESAKYEVSVEKFSIYYKEHLAIYSNYLLTLLARNLKSHSQLDSKDFEQIDLIAFALQIQPRWAEIVTFEELNLQSPDFIEPWKGNLKESDNPVIVEYFKQNVI